MFDEDAKDNIDLEEFGRAFELFDVHPPENSLKRLFDRYDTDGKANLSVEEFKAMLAPKDPSIRTFLLIRPFLPYEEKGRNCFNFRTTALFTRTLKLLLLKEKLRNELASTLKEEGPDFIKKSMEDLTTTRTSNGNRKVYKPGLYEALGSKIENKEILEIMEDAGK